MEERKNREYRKMRRIYGVNDERSQQEMSVAIKLQMKVE